VGGASSCISRTTEVVRECSQELIGSNAEYCDAVVGLEVTSREEKSDSCSDEEGVS
jgi:hypothetical protein